jgi:F subunit of K+-transporting ATPase (Potass_KdpF)
MTIPAPRDPLGTGPNLHGSREHFGLTANAGVPFETAGRQPIKNLVFFMTAAEGLLLAVSVAVFIYLGIAIFKSDRF